MQSKLLGGRARPRVTRGALRFSDAAVLAAVGTVVLLVSLPRLRDFALRENETDARALVERLGHVVDRSGGAARNATIEQVVLADETLATQLDDAEFFDDGVLMRRHGYLFELDSSEGEAMVRAWPWCHRKTGFAAYAWRPDVKLVGHANKTGDWSGPDAPPRFAGGAGWLDLIESP